MIVHFFLIDNQLPQKLLVKELFLRFPKSDYLWNYMVLIVYSSFFKLGGNDWYMLSGRISESVPVRRTRNCETRIRSWRTTEPCTAICTVLTAVFYVVICFLTCFNISSTLLPRLLSCFKPSVGLHPYFFSK